ncbi:uncharacterized protein BDZ99DRAFT_500237 [Mytilinidion resinicola]|uniref:Uncharacterized protein n=1 Tax=Mytilinidion resinicola TaxID=574789 RepID=A0A6A6YJ56_9PEZI|nr:uncharacterized protein BDZ99DRAFT_500237 [Mytilinidion resinicola]KAF2807957.1 hypothetical protein BDZ99DRAFT_500237 [Mytilinidion resinicola]
MAQYSSVPAAPYAPTDYISPTQDVDLGDSKTPHTSTATGYFTSPDPSGRKRQERAGGHQKRLAYKKTYIFANFWVYEVAACVVAVVLHLVTILLLHHYNNTNVQLYHNHWSLNSEVAILVTITKAASLIPIAACIGQLKWHRFWNYQKLSEMEAFDEASRGTIGSARLLVYLNFWHFASFGALVTVSALVMDTLAQNVINIEPRLQPVKNNATIPRNVVYDSVFTYNTNGTSSFPAADMIGAMNFGLSYTSSDLPYLPPLPFSCFSSNCTYAPYQSLEVDGDCRDISSVLDTSDDAYLKLPEGLMLIKNGGILNTSATALYSSNEFFDWKNMGQLILNYQAIYVDAYNDYKPSAVQCVLVWAVTTYSTTNVTRGELWATPDLTTFKNTSAEARTAYGQTNDIYIRPEPCYVNGTKLDSSTDPNCLYQVDAKAQFALQKWLIHSSEGIVGSLFNVTDSYGNNTHFQTFFVNSQYQALIRYASQLAPAETFLATGAYLAGMMNRAMALRVPAGFADGDGRLSGHGTVFELQSFFKMRYAYLSLNHFVVAGCVVFLVMTVWMCRRDEVLKTSVLPFLYHGLPVHDRQMLDENPRQADMKYSAEETIVKFGMTPEGKRLGTQETFGPGA